MKKNAKDYYIVENYNCAETTLRLANEYYKLNITEDDLKLVAGFGGGFGCGMTCGNLCADIAVLSKIYVEKKAHEGKTIGRLCKMFVSEFKKKFNGTSCAYIKKRVAVDQNRCLSAVEENFELLKDFISRN